MRCRPLTIALLIAVGAFSLLVTACGGGGGAPGVASVASSTTPATTTAQTGLVAFADCMRTHGVPGFPEPGNTGVIEKTQVVAAREANRSKFDAAQTACNHLLPNGGLEPPQTPEQQHVQLADALSFARCMRSHGVNRFPDPTSQGQLTIAMVQAEGIDVHSPAVLHAVQACLPASHGALTPAKVREALNNAGG